MNKQGIITAERKVKGGIEWCKTRHPDLTETQGHTWNPVSGCRHRCRWIMPNGEEAICYAEDTAAGVAIGSFPQGFEAHYFHPDRLDEPCRLKEPSRIFLDSMGDLMGNWVPEAEIKAVLGVARKCPHHVFLLLTKNAPRLLKFEFPPNVHVGVSAPPSKMHGKDMTADQQWAMVIKQLDTLNQIVAPVRWMSIEPLSFDISEVFETWIQENGSGLPLPLEWAVVGAASRGQVYFQPDPAHMRNVLSVLDANKIPVFFKGNIKWDPFRENFPAIDGRTLMVQGGLL